MAKKRTWNGDTNLIVIGGTEIGTIAVSGKIEYVPETERETAHSSGNFMLEKGKMMDSREAEARAREFIKRKRSRVRQIFFRTMYKEGDTWVLHGEVEFKRAYFFATVSSFKVQVNMNTGEVISYEEMRLSRSKETK